MIELLLSKAGALLGAVLAAVGAVVAVYLSGRKAGRDALARQNAEAAVNVAQERAHAETDAARTADPRAELRRNWRRS